LAEDRAKSFLQLIRRAQRGRLKVYLGYGPGVGKTYMMLQEAHRLKADRIDIVVGIVETHGRADTAKLVEGLELIPRRGIDYRGIRLDEMDVDAVLARRPQVALVDELAHTNAPGSRNAKRYDDVREILAAGIHVIATLNVQHLESLYNTVEQLVGVKVRERIPDSVLAEADQIVNVDLTTEDLRRRLTDGKIYPKERVAPALENFFTEGNLEHLRELTMREIASQIDIKRREMALQAEDEGKIAPDQIMVCLASKGPNSARLLRFASRLAGRLNRNWYALYVQTPSEAPTRIDATTQRVLGETLTLANQLGATVFTFKGQSVVDTILKFAREYRVGTIVIGRPRHLAEWKRRLLGKRSVAEELVIRAEGYAVVVVDATVPGSGAKDSASVDDVTSEEVTKGPLPAILSNALVAHAPSLTSVLHPERVVILDEPVTKAEVVHELVERIAVAYPELDVPAALASLRDREERGSTFLNEGVAVPHAHVKGLSTPQAALAILRRGVSDVATERPIETVFLLLEPESVDGLHMTLVPKAVRIGQDPLTRRDLAKARTAQEVLAALRDGEPA
jgi:two-component system sensor histidine kinase KdpD